jgi:hypothetical protein
MEIKREYSFQYNDELQAKLEIIIDRLKQDLIDAKVFKKDWKNIYLKTIIES